MDSREWKAKVKNIIQAIDGKDNDTAIAMVDKLLKEEDKSTKTCFGLPPSLNKYEYIPIEPPIYFNNFDFGFSEPGHSYYIEGITEESMALINGRLPHFSEILDRKLLKGVNFIKQDLTIARRCKDYKFTHSSNPARTSRGEIAHCNVTTKEILFNSRDLELMPWYEFIETLLHEVAHIRHCNHGRGWRSEFNKFIQLLEELCPGWVEPVNEATSDSNDGAAWKDDVNDVTGNNYHAHLSQLAEEEVLKTSQSGFKSQDGHQTPLVGSSPTARTNLIGKGICPDCMHDMTNNLHGFDQNDGYLNEKDELVHHGSCTYCLYCRGEK